MALFSKSSSEESFKRSPRKADSFFRHAETVADARNYPYAIECYINGLRHEPDSLERHEQLLDVAKRYKVGGGKPAGLKEKLQSLGSGDVDKMLQAEKLWAKDVTNTKLLVEVASHGADANEAEGQLDLGEVVFWAANMAMEQNAASKKPDKKTYVALKELFRRVGRWDKAVEATKRAIAVSGGDDNLLAELKDLEAERTMQEGKYGGGEEGDFRQNIKDSDEQKALAREKSTHGGGDANAQLIAQRRAEYEDAPEDTDKLTKLVDSLIRSEAIENENEAIKLLRGAHESTGQYRYRVRAGDIKMKQYNRVVRQLSEMAEAAPEDEEYQEKFAEAKKRRLAFEMQEYRDRVQNYPTDLSLKFELGKRLFLVGEFDEAIGMFQQAKADPKARAQSHLLLGRCYVHKQWLDEAIDTLRQGMEHHPDDSDRLGKELRYDLMDALARLAEKNSDAAAAKEAQGLASKLLQTDINYRDIKQRMDQIRTLGEKLQGTGSGSAA